MLSIRAGIRRFASSISSHSPSRRGFSTIPVCIRTIREDGDKQYLDMDVDLSTSLLDSLKGKVPIRYGCGGKGICGQCQIALPKDVYSRIPKPSQAELDTLATSLDPPPYSRLACKVVPTPIFRGRTIDVFIPFE
ncbi:hypothetical protein WA538_001520 [Blastocystis sp. DL]